MNVAGGMESKTTMEGRWVEGDEFLMVTSGMTTRIGGGKLCRSLKTTAGCWEIGAEATTHGGILRAHERREFSGL